MTIPRRGFVRGLKAGMNARERAMALNLFRKINPKDLESDQERLVLFRMIKRLMGHPLHNIPLDPPKECPICERTIAGDAFERHHAVCNLRSKKDDRMRLKIDPVVWEMLGGKI